MAYTVIYRNNCDMKHPFTRVIAVVWLLIVFSLYTQHRSAAAERVALVIGINEYAHAPRLSNPRNDAYLVGRTLKSMGFDVTIKFDLHKSEFEDALSEFAKKSGNANISLIYYAGHGIQAAGKVYLIPADRKVASGRDLRLLINVESLLEHPALAKRLSVIILDACRNNPFTKILAENFGPTNSVKIGQGLARIGKEPRNTLIAYATSAGNVALDGSGANSPFAMALTEHLKTPGLDVRIAFGAVRDQVLELTNHRQEPFIYGSLGGGTIALTGPTVTPVSVVVNPFPNVTDLLAVSGDYASWVKIIRSGSWSDLSRFHQLASDSYYFILTSKLLADRQGNPVHTLESAIDNLDKQLFKTHLFPCRWIVKIQKKLASACFYGGEIDGDWGEQSERALAAFVNFQDLAGHKRYGTLRRLGEYADSQDVTGHLSGRWSGRYFYSAPVKGVTDVPFEMNLTVSQSRISGFIVEPNTFGDASSKNLYTHFDGRIIGNRVNWRKRYDGTGGVSHDVIYTGAMNRSNNRISGERKIGKHVGDFHIALDR